MTAEGEARARAHLARVVEGVEVGKFCMHCLRPMNDAIPYPQACLVCTVVGPAVTFAGELVNPKYAPPPEAARPKRRRR